MKKLVFLCLLAFLCFTVNAFAIPASYGTATHSTTAWQELGVYDGDSMLDQYGVSWTTDGGSTWGRNQQLYVGQTVQFRFDLHKKTPGTHYADFLKSWVDWGNDGTFEEEDVIAFDYQVLKTTPSEYADYKNDFFFLSEEFDITDSLVGDLFLRARVTCSESLRQDWDAQWNTTSTWYDNNFFANDADAERSYYQGEAEEWVLNVAPVPEPSTILLLSGGLLGLGWYGRKRKK